MKTYNIYLLDDDEVFLSEFKSTVQEYFNSIPGSFSVFTFTSCKDFLKSSVSAPPDLIFADIKLPGEAQSGIAFMRELREKGCNADIVFLTGFLHFATDVFELCPIYFILKSEYQKRLPCAVDIFLKRIEERRAVLKVSIGCREEIIPIDSIIYCERSSRKTIISCTDKSICITAPLSELAQQLPAVRFAFVHQSILVNLQYVERFGKNDITMNNGTLLPISRSHTEDFKNAMTVYLSR